MASTVVVAGFPASQKTPGAYLNVVLGGPGSSSGSAPSKLLLFGNMISSAITGAAPTLSVAAGTAALNVPVQVFSVADARTKFGAGSELVLMVAAALAQNPTANIWCIPTAEGSTASTVVITMTGTPTAAYTIRIAVAGRACDVSVGVSDTVTTIATAIATAINQQTDWPVTAQFSSGVVTVTAKHAGLRGTNIPLRAYMIQGTSTTKVTAAALAGTVSGSVLTLSGGTAIGTSHAYHLAGGTTEESLTTPLASVAAVRYHRYVLAQQGATALAAVATQISTMAGVTVGLRQQAVAASVDTYANAIALSGARNAPRLCLAWSYANDLSTGEIAAQVAAGRLGGDSSLGGGVTGEDADPACNLDGLRLATIPAQDVQAASPTPTEIESALNNGLTPLAPLGTSGLMSVPRTITTRFKDDVGNPSYAVIDTQVDTVADYVADTLQSAFAVDFAGLKLAADAADGSAPKVAGVTTPNTARAYIFRKLKDFEGAGILTSVDAKASQLVVVADSTPGRLLADIPIVPIPPLHQIGGNVRAINS